MYNYNVLFSYFWVCFKELGFALSKNSRNSFILKIKNRTDKKNTRNNFLGCRDSRTLKMFFLFG